MYTYGQAELILATLHGADRERQETTLRARLKTFKKLGIPLGSNPGRGKKILYSKDQLYQWIFCLECSELGIDPAWIAKHMEKYWPTVYGLFKKAGQPPSRIDDGGDDPRKYEPEPQEDWFMAISPALMSGSWSGELATDPIDPRRPFFTHIPESRIPETVARMRGKSRRIALINVTEITRQVREAERNLPEHRRYLEELREELLAELRAEQAASPPEPPERAKPRAKKSTKEGG